MAKAVAHLAELGHKRIARVSGPLRLEHAALRWRYFEEACRTTYGRTLPQLATDYTAPGGLACTRRLLASRRPPTAIVYDNDVMAAAAVTELTSTGVRIPADLAVLAWDDSPLCELVRPAITAFTHDVTAEASTAARLLLDHVETEAARDVWLDARVLTVRASTVSSDG